VSRVRDGGLERHALPSPFLYLGDEPGPVGGWGEITLNGFLDFAATQAACADPNAFWLTVDQCPDWLEVGLEDPLGLVIGVTDVMAGLTTFATEIACKCHGCTPSSSRMLKKSSSGVLAAFRGSTYRSVRLASSLAAALLGGLFEHPAWCTLVVPDVQSSETPACPQNFSGSC